jgi:TRAP-type C4-dicarboxylate transport system substrate-binding protein
MNITRRSVLKSSAALAAVLPCPYVARAAQAEFVYKFGVDLPASHPTSTWARNAADRIKSETGNRLEIQIFQTASWARRRI